MFSLCRDSATLWAPCFYFCGAFKRLPVSTGEIISGPNNATCAFLHQTVWIVTPQLWMNKRLRLPTDVWSCSLRKHDSAAETMSAKLQDFHTEPERRAALLFAQVAPRAARSEVPVRRLKVGNTTLEMSQKSFKKIFNQQFWMKMNLKPVLLPSS